MDMMNSVNNIDLESGPHRRPRPLLVRFLWWAGVLLLGLALGLWVNASFEERSMLSGEELARSVVQLNREAFRLAGEGRRAEAIASLQEAQSALESGDFESAPVYVYTLTDLANLLLTPESESTGVPRTQIDQAIEKLDKAWEAASAMTPEARARIARSRGWAGLAAGELEDAARWYARASELVPEDEAVQERLRAVREAQELADD